MYLEPADMEVDVESCMPFKVEVPDEALADLRERLRRTRFIDDFDRAGWTYGVSRSYLEELCEYWSTTFDWRAQEAILNSFDQFRVVLDRQSLGERQARNRRAVRLASLRHL